jgi:hypothetical protein
MNKYYEAIRFVEEKLLRRKPSDWAANDYAAERAIETLYELLDLYIKEKTKVVFK